MERQSVGVTSPSLGVLKGQAGGVGPSLAWNSEG